MFSKLLLTAFLGAQIVAGAVVVQKNAENMMPLAPAERWSYEDCGRRPLDTASETQSRVAYRFSSF